MPALKVSVPVRNCNPASGVLIQLRICISACNRATPRFAIAFAWNPEAAGERAVLFLRQVVRS